MMSMPSLEIAHWLWFAVMLVLISLILLELASAACRNDRRDVKSHSGCSRSRRSNKDSLGHLRSKPGLYTGFGPDDFE